MTSVNLHNRFRRGDPDHDLAFLKLARPVRFSQALIHLCLPAKDFCEKVLMRSGTKGITKRRGAQTQELGYMTLEQCRGQLNISHRLSNKMFCMRRNDAAGRPEEHFGGFSQVEAGNSSKVQNEATEVRRCSPLLPGTPVATVDRGTAYLTGLLKSPSSDCGGGMVFTKISRYLSWIKRWMNELNDDMTPQISQFPSTF